MKGRFVISLLLLFISINETRGQGNYFQKFVNPLDIPELIDAQEINLNVQEGEYSFFNNSSTPTYGINGNYLGPTLLMKYGDSIRINVTNHLDAKTTMHWHGFHVPAKFDGGPRTTIHPGETWSPKFKILDQAATYWYHPHPHGLTTQQVTLGLLGMIIIQDEEEQALAIPRTYGYDDIPLIVQSKSFAPNSKEIAPLGSETHFIVNSTVYPFCEVPKQLVRLRILNGSNLRVINLGWSDNRTFYQIASDGGLLPNPIPLKRIKLATGERAEILVDFSNLDNRNNPNPIYLTNYALQLPQGTPGTLFTAAPSILDIQNVEVMEFRTVPSSEDTATSVPGSLRPPYVIWDESEVDVVRNFSMEVNLLELIFSGFINGFSFDNQLFDHHIVNHVVHLDDVEIWEIYNNTPFSHPFHIHDQQFYILDRNGIPPPLNEQGRKDVVLINRYERVRIITKFEDFADDEYTYMYHCHILSHEDEGMMGQFLVIDPAITTNVNYVEQNAAIDFFPNPATSYLQINNISEINDNNETYYFIYNTNGGLVKFNKLSQAHKIDIESLSTGEYILQLRQPNTILGQSVFSKF